MTAVHAEPATSRQTEAGPYFGLHVPFMEHIGLEAEHIEDGYARTRLPASGNMLKNIRA